MNTELKQAAQATQAEVTDEQIAACVKRASTYGLPFVGLLNPGGTPSDFSKRFTAEILALRPEPVPMSMGKAVMYGTHLYAGIMKGEVREVKNSVLIEFSSRQDWGAFLRWHDGIAAADTIEHHPENVAAKQDAAALNWIERQHLEELGMGLVIDAPNDGMYYVCGDSGTTHYGKTLREALAGAIHQAGAKQVENSTATTEPVEDGIRNAEDELNCAEEVLDAITCEFSDGEFPVADFNCIGDYITAVVGVFKERLAARQPATTEPVVSRNPFASRCYTMSESHLSGHRLIVGFEKLGDAQDAAEAIDWLLKNIRLDAPQLSGKAMGNAEKCASALRAALAQQPATATACGIPGMAKTTCPYCELSFTFEQPVTTEPTVPQEHEAYSRYLDAATPDRSAQVFYAADGGDDETGAKYYMTPYVHWFDKTLAADTKRYTRPAPSLPDSIDPPTEDGTEYDYASGYTAGYAAGWNEYRAGMAWLLDPKP